MNKMVLLLVLLFGFSAYAAMSGKDIMAQNEENRKLDDVQAEATLTTGGAGGAEKIKKFTWWKKLDADKVHYKTLTRFSSPAEIRGESILFLEHPGNENEVMIYLPNFKKIRRVESAQQSGSFMGSEFSYSDISTPHVEDYHHRILKDDEACPGDASLKCYVIEATPVSDAVKERMGYSKVVHWIRKDNFMGVHGEFYNADQELFKKLDASETKQVDSQKNKWMAHRIRIEGIKTGKFTELQFMGLKVNKGIQDSIFTQQNMQRN